jgi:hypothetical protein
MRRRSGPNLGPRQVTETRREAGHPQVADDRRIEVTGFRAPHAHGIGIYVDPVIRNATPLRSRLYRRPHPASRTQISPGCEMSYFLIWRSDNSGVGPRTRLS